jgi:hypothetical protein
MAQRPRVQAANLHGDTFGYPGAARQRSIRRKEELAFGLAV